METVLLIILVAAAAVALGAVALELFRGRWRILALLRRELLREFGSPRAYLLLALFTGLSGLWFYSGVLPGGLPSDAAASGTSASAALGVAFRYLPMLLVFLVPLLTMRLFAEEVRAGTIETLLTAPVTDLELVVAKFLAAGSLYVLLLATTIWQVAVLFRFGRPGPDPGGVLATYLGWLLLGGLLIAVGELASALTQNQTVAAAGSFVPAFVLLLLPDFRETVSDWPAAASLLDYAALPTRLAGFLDGQVLLADVVYFLSLTALALFLTVRVVESRRWR